MGKQINAELQDVVIRFSGDSGDGMQLTGTQFSNTSALFGNDVATFPDYPAEIRAPQGTVGGVSGFQLHFGKVEIDTPGDYSDVLVAMNPAALRANLKWVKDGGTIILDINSFSEKNLKRAGYVKDPLPELKKGDYNIIEAPVTKLTKEALVDSGLDKKTILRSKNMFTLGMVYWIYDRPLHYTEQFFETKFAKKPEIIEANKKVLKAGFNFANTIEALHSHRISPARIKPGIYRNISGNVATAWGLMAAAEKANLKLFVGSYPITPATDILQELAEHKSLGVKTFQAEDEIAGIVTSIGASFAGSLAATTTSGPGLALKTEAIGLAIITELPLVIVNVQRGGPSTGLPTKTEQADLMQAVYGRNGEAPIPVIAASTPADCFKYAFEASRIALEHMTPVILLTDGFLANGSEPWKIAKMEEYPEIKVPMATKNKEYFPYERDEKHVRKWAVPGMPGLEHRIGGLEKMTKTGNVSYVPENHQLMTDERQAKVDEIANHIPELIIKGDENADLLLVGWGGTYGHIRSAVKKLIKEGYNVAGTHFNYIYPLPKNTKKVLEGFDKIVICELNSGQFKKHLTINFPEIKTMQYNKIQGLPFTVNEIIDYVKTILDKPKEKTSKK